MHGPSLTKDKSFQMPPANPSHHGRRHTGRLLPKDSSLKHRESHIWVKQTTFWFTARPKTAQTFHPCKLAFWFLPSLSLTFKIKGSRRRIEGSISWTTAGRRSRCAICPGGGKKSFWRIKLSTQASCSIDCCRATAMNNWINEYIFKKKQLCH